MGYSKESLVELQKLKHELLGSLGVIRTLAVTIVIEEIDELKAQKYLNLIEASIDRNIHIIIDFNIRMKSQCG